VSNASISGNTSGHEKNSNGRGSIYPIKLKSGATRYRAAIHDINGKRRTKNFKKKAEAEDWLAMQRQSRNQGLNTYATNPKMTVGDYLLGWVESHKSMVKHSTYRSYKSCIKNQINPRIGKQIAANLTTKAIESFYGTLVANQIGGGTLNLVHRTLSCAFSDAVRLGDLPRNPVLNARKPNIRSVPTKAIPSEHWKKIYREAMKNPFAHARIDIGLMSGLRPGEVLGLKWDDIDFEREIFTIERQVQRGASGKLEFQSVKQNQIRTMKSSEAQMNILLTHKRYQALTKAKWTIDENLVFPNSIGGKLDEKKDRAEFKKLLKAAGVPDYQLYQLRKTCFTNASPNTDVRTMQAFSGHSQVSTLMGSYVFPTSESMKSLVNAMDKLRPTKSNV
jgi:integrase